MPVVLAEAYDLGRGQTAGARLGCRKNEIIDDVRLDASSRLGPGRR
jgi:hypothetical protein